jgi:hypothetical protein
MSWSSKWSLCLWLPHQYPIHVPLLPHSHCILHLSHLWDLISLIIFGKK